MNTYIEPEDIIATAKSFLDILVSQEQRNLVINIACELLDVSQDKLLEMLQN